MDKDINSPSDFSRFDLSHRLSPTSNGLPLLQARLFLLLI